MIKLGLKKLVSIKRSKRRFVTKKLEEGCGKVQVYLIMLLLWFYKVKQTFISSFSHLFSVCNKPRLKENVFKVFHPGSQQSLYSEKWRCADSTTCKRRKLRCQNDFKTTLKWRKKPSKRQPNLKTTISWLHGFITHLCFTFISFATNDLRMIWTKPRDLIINE